METKDKELVFFFLAIVYKSKNILQEILTRSTLIALDIKNRDNIV